ncbi:MULTISPECIES: hypothetical protein [Microbulbifer]|uniref:hypothetical protein n=1 Tax=Microbulbifer TaxID=48073 RepID=UPI001E4790A4|nr:MULTISPECIES: hypothetical protein [Microbulbifer]UHQ54646.1 hypothetical protein LVE68_14215 [Microbulbifer sp. YPW16]
MKEPLGNKARYSCRAHCQWQGNASGPLVNSAFLGVNQGYNGVTLAIHFPAAFRNAVI